MTELNDAFELRLRAIFADEARVHLAQFDAGLAALGQAGVPAQAALVASVHAALHTLKGAARSVGLDELEYLCRALESVFAAFARAGAGPTPAQLERIRPAVGLAGLLVEPPAGRIRNQALALTGQLDALARELAAGAETTLVTGI